MKHRFGLLLIVCGVAFALPRARSASGEAEGRWEPVRVTGTIDDKRATAAMLVYVPAGYTAATPSDAAARKYPLVIALHGWNQSPEMVRDKADLTRWADLYALVIAVPAMSTTIYESSLYPESKRTWSTVPGARWVGEVILPYMRANYAVSNDRAHTAVIGYSTGGRGALLLAETYPEFDFAGSISGTFDLMRLPPGDGEYKIHAGVYGPRNKFQKRWELDNVISEARLAKLAGTRLFIAHGAKDTVVLPDQLVALRDAVHDRSAIKAEFALSPDGGHTWSYWNEQWEAMFRALATALRLEPVRPVTPASMSRLGCPLRLWPTSTSQCAEVPP